MKYKDPDYMTKWRVANKERIRIYRKARYESHKEEENRKNTEWSHANKPRVSLISKAASANRYYRGMGILTVSDVVKVIERSKRTCHWCGKKNLQNRDLTLEHLKPMNDIRFITIACYRCNSGRVINNGGKFLTEEELKARDKARSYRWVANNLEKRKEYQKLYMRNRRGGLHPKILKTPEELKATVSAYNKKYAEEHKDEIRQKRLERDAKKNATITIWRD